ncbi:MULTISPECIES: class I SAM-dependent methyltransferase [Amycolatopsis]|uniref:Class I SAM-dependent methyltransferase n=1 Tax=Amycolatopsis dendrobii TaxID=2760662 RepID=A0A7W3W4U5_9PSEU|nr:MULTISPECIES: class I SAM-dependent methyltransferase [Amycolatopsis]MBB1158800.1 class I SAM-dependent methyltransferase [Amycolatopsis dendrobii]UKD59568.1 class I SAM-dependent methyltransferase [Amycolatopsis sp. FU40]
MGPRDTLLAGFAKQLGHPRGRAGQAVVRLLNNVNRGPVTAAVEALEIRRGETALDLGFGGGLGLDLLLRATEGGAVHGAEISETALARARRTFPKNLAAGRLVLHQAGMAELPLGDGTIDAALTVNTVYFIPDLAPAFAEVARVLSGGGRFVVGIGDPSTMREMPFTSHGFRLRPPEEIEQALADAGLELRRHDRLGDGPKAFHLLVAGH